MKQGNTCSPGSCGPCGHHCGSRSFLTKEEKIEMLKERKEAFENEVKGMTERITELEKGK